MKLRMRSSVPLLAASTLYLCLPVAAQEKSSARDMFFGGLEATAPQVRSPKPTASKPAPPPKPQAGRKPDASVSAKQQSLSQPQQPAQPPRPSVPVVNTVQAPLGLRYALLKMTGMDATEVPVSTRFHSGDRLQLRVQANADGYLYIVSQGSSGAWQVMFPSPSRNSGSNRVKAGEDHTSIFRFDSKPGVEKLFIVLSRAPVKDLDSVIYDLKGNPEPQKEPMMLASNLTVNDPLVSRLRNSYTRDMVLEEVAAPETSERAMYVVNKSAGPDARVVADLKLVHE